MLRQQICNIPIEMVRTIVAIAETGSLSKAAERLNLTQPAVSAQIRRLQGVVGGELFIRSTNGTMLTDLGKLALPHARRILDSNDQLLRLCGSDRAPVHRLGLSQLLAPALFGDWDRDGLSNVFFLVEHSHEIRRGLVEGFIDVACLFLHEDHTPDVERLIVHEIELETSWIKARDFVTSPGAPVRIVTQPEDGWIVGPLDRDGTPYRVVLRSSDSAARISAVRAGLGISAVPSIAAPPDLVRSRDYYLPKLAPTRVVVCRRDGLTDPATERLVQRLWTSIGQFMAPNISPDQHLFV